MAFDEWKVFFVVPVLTAAVIFVLLANPELTGFAVAPSSSDVLDAGIRVVTADGVIIPHNSTIEVGIGGESSEMPISVFIEKAGGKYELVFGELKEIGYKGLGYTGNHTYTIPFSEFSMDVKLRTGTNRISVGIKYGDRILSASETDVVV